MTVLLTIDIETVPCQRPDILAELKASMSADLASKIAAIAPPGNYKKQETIDAWYADEAPKIRAAMQSEFENELDSAYRKTSFDGAFGQVCVIGFAINDEPAITLFNTDWQDERTLLENFACCLTSDIEHKDFVTVVGHNVASFDLRFLMHRYIVNGIRPHSVISRAAQAKPWESDKVFDTMVQWAGVGNRIKLDKLCKALNVPTPKGELDGSKVWDYVNAGRIEEVAAYCKKDVEATRQVYKRMTFATELQAA